MSKHHVGIEECIDFPCSTGTLDELFPRSGIKNKKKRKKNNVVIITDDNNDEFGDFLNADEEYITY